MEQRVVIVGGGFGGVHAALKLANKPGIIVRLISDQNYFEYHAALYRSATGRSPLEVAVPLKEFFAFARNVEVVQDSVTAIHQPGKHIIGGSGSYYHYDKLILAVGGVTADYGIAGIKDRAYGVKTIHEALRLKRHLHEQLVAKDIEQSYVVIGGGASGVELAAELVSYLAAVRQKHRVRRSFKVYLIEAGPRVLGILPEAFSAKAEQRLRRVGVELLVNTPVHSVAENQVQLPGRTITTHTVIWTAGITNHPLLTTEGLFTLGRGKKVAVNEYLEAAPDIYVVGDSADTPFSGMAQTALHNAKFAASDILAQQAGRKRRPYQPKRPIYAIPIGRRWSAVRWGKLEIYAWPGWTLRRLADLRLYLTFLSPGKALTTWKYGFKDEEACPVCRH